MATASETDEIRSLLDSAEAAFRQNDGEHACAILYAGLEQRPDNLPLMLAYGRMLRRCGRISDARHILRHAQEREPDQPEVLAELGLVLQRDGDLPEALKVYLHYAGKHPDDPRARIALADATTTAGHPDRALPEIETLMQKFPDRNPYRVSYARTLNRMGRYTEALEILDPLVNERPDYRDAWIFIAEANWGLQRHAAWMQAARKSTESGLENPTPHYWMARVALHENDPEQALAHLNRALELHPRFYQAHAALGELYWKHGREDNAARSFQTAVEIAPWDGETLGMQAQFLAATGRETPDLERLGRYAREVPYSRLAYYLGRIYLSARFDPARAVEWLKFAADRALQDLNIRRLLADAYLAAGQNEAAIQEFQIALGIQPGFAEAWRGLAYATLQAGRYLQSEQAHAQAVEVLPQDANVRHGYGLALLMQGKAQAAIPQLTLARQLDPQNGEMALALSHALAQTGQREEARRQAAEARSLLGDRDDVVNLFNQLNANY